MEAQKKAAQMGRPKLYSNHQVRFEMMWSADLIELIDAHKGRRSRKAYVEHLLRTHPEMQSQDKDEDDPC